jgi:hypothetical protein
MFVDRWELLSKFEGKNHPMAVISDWKEIKDLGFPLGDSLPK